jgi:hypothetical protein
MLSPVFHAAISTQAALAAVVGRRFTAHSPVKVIDLLLIAESGDYDHRIDRRRCDDSCEPSPLTKKLQLSRRPHEHPQQ